MSFASQRAWANWHKLLNIHLFLKLCIHIGGGTGGAESLTFVQLVTHANISNSDVD